VVAPRPSRCCSRCWAARPRSRSSWIAGPANGAAATERARSTGGPWPASPTGGPRTGGGCLRSTWSDAGASAELFAPEDAVEDRVHVGEVALEAEHPLDLGLAQHLAHLGVGQHPLAEVALALPRL